MQSHSESAQTLHLFCLYQNQDFSAYLSHKQCCVHYLLALEAVDILDPFLIKAAQPENLFSLEVFFLYISNLPWTAAHQVPLPWDFPGKHTGVGCHSLLQGIFPTQGPNP